MPRNRGSKTVAIEAVQPPLISYDINGGRSAGTPLVPPEDSLTDREQDASV